MQPDIWAIRSSWEKRQIKAIDPLRGLGMKPLNKAEADWLLTVREHKHFVSRECPYARRQCRKALLDPAAFPPLFFQVGGRARQGADDAEGGGVLVVGAVRGEHFEAVAARVPDAG